MTTLFSILLLVFLTIVNAFFAMSEVAIITLNDTKIERLAETGHKQAAKVLKLTKDNSGFLATIQVCVTFAGFLNSAFAANSFADDLSGVFSTVPFLKTIAHPLATVIITLLLSFFNLVFGELVPKKVGMQKAEAVSYKIVDMLLFTGKIFRPFVWLLSITTNAVTRLIGLDPNAEQETLTEEEILMMVDVGGEKGVIEESERNMIANIFEFGDTTVSEIMTHRTEIYGVEIDETVPEICKLTIETGFSRLPVYEEEIDSIVGVLYVKDMLKYVGQSGSEEVKARDVMRETYFIPESKRLDELFDEMTARKQQLAVVVDEYGGTAGIITMEDLIESILGSIQDEYDDEEDEISKVSENCFTVDGTASVDEVSEMIGYHIPEGDYETVAGFIVTTLGMIPSQGENPVVESGCCTFTVSEVEDRRVSKILITVDRTKQQEELAEKNEKRQKKESEKHSEEKSDSDSKADDSEANAEDKEEKKTSSSSGSKSGKSNRKR